MLKSPRARTDGSGTGLTINCQLINSLEPPADISAMNRVQVPLAFRPLNRLKPAGLGSVFSTLVGRVVRPSGCQTPVSGIPAAGVCTFS